LYQFVKMKSLILLAITCFIPSCANPNAYKSPQPKAEFLTMVDRKFTSPTDGTIFQLTLGKQLDSNDRGVTPIPDGIIGERSATDSYYSIKGKQGLVHGKVESSIAEGFEHSLKFIEIQHERSSGRILVTEDTSDALPVMRYILFTPTHPGYSVDYLAPRYENNFEKQGFPDSPPRIILLPDDKVWVGGEILPFSEIRKSKHAFSLGG
jgi:hypothetical protein